MQLHRWLVLAWASSVAYAFVPTPPASSLGVVLTTARTLQRTTNNIHLVEKIPDAVEKAGRLISRRLVVYQRSNFAKALQEQGIGKHVFLCRRSLALTDLLVYLLHATLSCSLVQH
jgi:hypothetical protein